MAVPPRDTITVTFGDACENHAGMQRLGQMAPRGFGAADLAAAAAALRGAGAEVEEFDLRACLPPDLAAGAPPAPVLIARGAVGALAPGGADALRAEMRALDFDTKAYMRGRVVNKRARHNLCVADAPQEPDYESKRGRVVAWAAVPRLAALRTALEALGPAWAGLSAELNLYYDPARCGIGYHGDGERRKVVGVRLGAPLPLQYHWFREGVAVGRPARFELRHGDLYVMGEKAAGTDWRSRKALTLRHAAGAAPYLALRPEQRGPATQNEPLGDGAEPAPEPAPAPEPELPPEAAAPPLADDDPLWADLGL